jgi:hypothetical protein
VTQPDPAATPRRRHTAGRNGLRLWYPRLGTVATVALGTRPRCVTTTGDGRDPTVVVGHDTGLLVLSLGGPGAVDPT